MRTSLSFLHGGLLLPKTAKSFPWRPERRCKSCEGLRKTDRFDGRGDFRLSGDRRAFRIYPFRRVDDVGGVLPRGFRDGDDDPFSCRKRYEDYHACAGGGQREDARRHQQRNRGRASVSRDGSRHGGGDSPLSPLYYARLALRDGGRRGCGGGFGRAAQGLSGTP